MLGYCGGIVRHIRFVMARIDIMLLYVVPITRHRETLFRLFVKSALKGTREKPSTATQPWFFSQCRSAVAVERLV